MLFAPEEPDSLADALYGLLSDRARAIEMGTAGAAGVHAHYTVDQMAAAAEQVYKRVPG